MTHTRARAEKVHTRLAVNCSRAVLALRIPLINEMENQEKPESAADHELRPILVAKLEKTTPTKEIKVGR
ncbi:hypothetical protein NDU88_000706 [Pleurodeles waltl]|uniref:Uncharacterized protein n=1 Tax=Pleurodeles waltl TaxID=8319 RepID=A0AAV7S9F1_PLEWA|nr:hypothetical protein NDU88_000706 [Pleurodeles waltl]